MNETLPVLRPQPLGVLPWPAGLLLIGAGPEQAVRDLVAGMLPDPWPEGWAYVRQALDGDPQVAAGSVPGEDPVAHYNRAVLSGDPLEWEHLAAQTTGELRALVDTARYTLGITDLPPETGAASGEVLAMVRSARASAAIERGDGAGAIDELRLAADEAAAAHCAVLSASLRLTLAEFLREAGQPQQSALVADAALQILPVTADRELRAHLQLTRALARQDLAGDDRGALLAVVGDLTEATKVFREDTHPELFGLCNQQLALAYLVMPMSEEGDRIRQGVAVNALRSALRVFTRESDPLAWATAQVNLANALQYLPSAHQERNLDEAVQLYEEVLSVRDPRTDPAGYARILSNQGNALGHLGVFGDARDRLLQARELFEQAGDPDSAGTVSEILAGLEAAAAGRGDG